MTPAIIILAVLLALTTASVVVERLQSPFEPPMLPAVAYMIAFNTIILIPAFLWGALYGYLTWAAIVVLGVIIRGDLR